MIKGVSPKLTARAKRTTNMTRHIKDKICSGVAKVIKDKGRLIEFNRNLENLQEAKQGTWGSIGRYRKYYGDNIERTALLSGGKPIKQFRELYEIFCKIKKKNLFKKWHFEDFITFVNNVSLHKKIF